MTKTEPNLLLVTKSLPVHVETKVLDRKEGIVQALVAVTNNLDEGGDVILPGGPDFGLKTMKVWPKGCLNHDMAKVVAKCLSATEIRPYDVSLPGDLLKAGYGAMSVETQFNLKTQAGADAFEDVKFFDGEQEWSVGYEHPGVFVCGPLMDVKQWEALKADLPELTVAGIEERGAARILPKTIVWEYSPVAFGMNRLTRTQGVKAMFTDEQLEELAAKLAPRVFDLGAKTPGSLIETPDLDLDLKLWIDAEDALGSDTFEARQGALCEAIYEWAKTALGENSWVNVLATWMDHVFFFAENWDSDDEGYWNARYTIDGSNEVTLDVPTPATINVSISAAPVKGHDALLDFQIAAAYMCGEMKADAARLATKEGRALAGRNVTRLKEMADSAQSLVTNIEAMLAEAPAETPVDEVKATDADLVSADDLLMLHRHAKLNAV